MSRPHGVASLQDGDMGVLLDEEIALPRAGGSSCTLYIQCIEILSTLPSEGVCGLS